MKTLLIIGYIVLALLIIFWALELNLSSKINKDIVKALEEVNETTRILGGIIDKQEKKIFELEEKLEGK